MPQGRVRAPFPCFCYHPQTLLWSHDTLNSHLTLYPPLPSPSDRPVCPQPFPADPARGGGPQAPECIRRQKRRELDARRSKCRIRIGGHLERWCRLKEQLGFALHSQLAQFLLDRSLGGLRTC